MRADNLRVAGYPQIQPKLLAELELQGSLTVRCNTSHCALALETAI